MNQSPRIRYAATEDSVDIAFAVFGDGPVIVDVSQVWGSLHLTQANVLGRAEFMARLVDLGWSVALFDARGTGSSEREVGDFSLQARMRDIDAVVRQLGLERFPLTATLQGTPAALEYAIHHPEQVSHLVLTNPFVVGAEYYASIPAMGLIRALREMAADQWDFFTQSLASAVNGFRDMREAQALAAAFRSGMSPKEFAAWRDESENIDLTARLRMVGVPTLVIHDESIGVANVRLARAVAAGIPDSRFVETVDAPGATSEFLGGRTVRVSAVVAGHPPGGAASASVVLFTDIADSTGLTERLGDARFREISRALDAGLRGAIRDAGGEAVEGKLLGDGVLATFPSAAQAIDGARRCLALSAASELGLHIGLHAGDVIREEGNVFGGAVNIASRICGLSAAGEILVSDVVRGMARSSAGVAFEDRGEQEMKGVGEPVRVYAVRWREE